MNGLSFSCKRCSHCCRHEPGYVYLSAQDLSALCQRFSLSEQEFIRRYCRWIPYYDGGEVLCLQEKANFDCVLWDGMCIAYNSRPMQCSTYPFWPFVVETEQTWNAEARECPGINQGSVVDKKIIEDCIRQYKAIIPIRKQEI